MYSFKDMVRRLLTIQIQKSKKRNTVLYLSSTGFCGTILHGLLHAVGISGSTPGLTTTEES